MVQETTVDRYVTKYILKITVSTMIAMYCKVVYRYVTWPFTNYGLELLYEDRLTATCQTDNNQNFFSNSWGDEEIFWSYYQSAYRGHDLVLIFFQTSLNLNHAESVYWTCPFLEDGTVDCQFDRLKTLNWTANSKEPAKTVSMCWLALYWQKKTTFYNIPSTLKVKKSGR